MYNIDALPRKTPRFLQYNDLPTNGGVAHAARTRYGPGDSISLHVHDFAEVFWIPAGSGYHDVGGRRERLRLGDVRIIHPEDGHALGAAAGESMSLVNVAFPPAHLKRIEAHTPRGATVSSTDLADIEAAARRLSMRPDSPIRLELLLLTIVDRIESTAGGPDHRRPAWLSATIETLEASPELLQEGVGGFVRLTGKSADHVCRVCRAVEGVTTSGLVNRLRLDRAAWLLAHSPEGGTGRAETITDVAFDSGFSNLSYFYRTFRERFGTSPRQYREAAQRTIRG